MADPCADFLAKFHNLPGDTVKEKHQNLFRLLLEHRSLLSANEELLQRITTHLEPTSHLEKILRVDFLIYFKRFRELYRELQSSDDITLSKIAKQDWFFQHAFKHLGADEFANDVLPTMSHAVKLKILKKLSLEEAQNDAIFDAILKRYGIFLASIFLPKCSVGKISETLRSHLIKLTPPQLKTIYNKSPDLVYVYLEERTKHEGNSAFMNKNPFFVFLAQKNPEMFAKLFGKYRFDASLGQRTTKRFLNSQKDAVLAQPEPYLGVLKKNSLVRKAGNELKDIFFTKDANSVMYWNSLLRYYPKHQQFRLFKTTYDRVHHHKFGDNIDAISEDILKIIPNPKEREKYALLKLKKEEDDKYLKYVTSQFCLKEFTERLANMVTSERATFIATLTYCCILNRDLDALLKVLEFVAVRFKNDDAKIRSEFVTSLYFEDSKMSILDEFTEKHWKFMIDIISNVTAKNEWIWNEVSVRIKYLEFLIKNHKPLSPFLAKYGDFKDYLNHADLWKKRELCRRVIAELVETGLPKAESDDDAARHDCRLAVLCSDFRREAPRFAVELHENQRIVNSLKHVLENETDGWGLRGGVEYLICRKEASSEELKALYFKHLEHFGTKEGCFWFLKHDPKTLARYFDDYLANFVKGFELDTKRFWRAIKQYSHLKLDQRAVEYCRLKLREEGKDEKTKLVRCLAIVSPPDSHLEFVKSYLPTSAKVDLEDDGVKELYLVQCELVKFLHLVNSPAAVLPVTLHFCKGDYLKSALSPLYSCMYNLPENETKPYVDKIKEDKAVSVKKHSVNLSCIIYDSATVYGCLKDAQVPSLMPTLKYFAKNSSKALWELLEQKIAAVEKSDLQIFKWVKNNMPLAYKSKYAEAVWTVLDKYENNQLKKLLISQIDKYVIQNLSPAFAYKFIEGSLFKIEEANDFISMLLIYTNDTGKFGFFSKLLALFKANLWKSSETRRAARRKLHLFVQSLYRVYMELENANQQFVTEFAKTFNSVFRPFEAFEEYVTVSFMQLKGESPETCGKFLIQLTNDLVKEYGKFVINLLASTIQFHVIPLLFKTESDQMRFCYSVFKFKENADHYLLIIRLLPRNEPEDLERFKLYNEILTDLDQVTETFVQLQFNLYLNSDDSGNVQSLTSDNWDRICICPCKT